MRSVRFGSTRIPYRLYRTGRKKTVGIAIDSRRGVVVRAPRGIRVVDVDGIVRHKAPWIVTRMGRASGNGRGVSVREFVSGESFPYLGRNYRLKIVPNRTDGVSVGLVGGRFLVRVDSRRPRRRRVEAVRGALEDWYWDHAAPKLKSRVDFLAPKLGVDVPNVLIRDQRMRWASCDSEGRLRFNWRIVMAPMSLVDYVVAHELCHLIYRDHSARFWRAMRGLLPDYQDRKHRLATEGHRYGMG